MRHDNPIIMLIELKQYYKSLENPIIIKNDDPGKFVVGFMIFNEADKEEDENSKEFSIKFFNYGKFKEDFIKNLDSSWTDIQFDILNKIMMCKEYCNELHDFINDKITDTTFNNLVKKLEKLQVFQ